MDIKEFKERYVSEGEHLEIEEIFVRHNKNSEDDEIHSFTESANNKQDKVGKDVTNLVNDGLHIDHNYAQKTEETDSKQPNLTDKLPEQCNYSDKSGIQEYNRFQQHAGPQRYFGFQQNAGFQQHFGFQQNTGVQQELHNPTYYPQNNNRNAARNQELNLMTDGVFIVQHNSQRMEVPYNQLNPNGRYLEEWEFPAKHGQQDHALNKDVGKVSTNDHGISRDLETHSQQNSHEFDYPQVNVTEKQLEQWKSSQKPGLMKQKSLRKEENVSINKDASRNNNMATQKELNSTELLLKKLKASDGSRKEDQLLAKDIENVLKNHEKVMSRDRDEKYTLEMQFSPKDVPFNIRVEPAKELQGFTASLEEVSSEENSQLNDITKSKKPTSASEKNRYRNKSLLNVDIEVVPLTVDQNFSADVDKSVFREQCVRRILKDDHKTKQPIETVAVAKSSSKNQSRPQVFLRDTPSKNVEDFKEEPNAKENVFERDFVRTKPNDVLQSWVQMMEGFLEDQKVKLRRKMYQIDQEDVLRGNDYDFDRRMRSGHDRSGVYEPTWIEEGITETNRMISRTQLYSNGIPQSQLHQKEGTTTKREDAAKKQGIMKVVKKKDNEASQKSKTGKNKTTKKVKRKLVEREGPAVYKPKGPVFKPPPLKADKEKKSFIKDVEKPIRRSSHGFGLIRKIPI